MNGSKHTPTLIHICMRFNHSDKEGRLEEEITSKILKPTHKFLLPLTGLQ